MKTIHLITLFIFLSIAFSCNNNEKVAKHTKELFSGYEKLTTTNEVKLMQYDDSGSRTIKIAKGDINNIDTWNYIDTVKYLKLETNNNCLIATIKNLYFDEKYIIVRNELLNLEQSVFIFDTTGRFVASINKKGKGPGEYSSIRDVAIDYNKHRVLIYDMDNRKILFFNYSGQFLTEKKTYFYFDALVVDKNNNYIFKGYSALNNHLPAISHYNLWVCDSNFHFLYKASPFIDKEMQIHNWIGDMLINQSPEVTYAPNFLDAILTITDDYKLKAKYMFDCGKNSVNYLEKLKALSGHEMDKYLGSRGERVYFCGFRSETSDFLYFMIHVPNALAHGFYNKNNGKLIIGKGIGTTPPKLPVFSTPAAAINDWFVGAIPANDFEEALKNNDYYCKKHPEAYKILKITKTEDNPILMFYKFKKF